MVFRTWSAYIEHCKHYRETPQDKPPEEVLERMMTFEYYCPMHDNGFNNRKLAARHLKGPQHKGVKLSEDDLRAHKEPPKTDTILSATGDKVVETHPTEG